MSNRSAGRLQTFWHIFLAFLTAWLIFNLYQTASYVAANYSPVPIFDYWMRPFSLWPQYKAFHWSIFIWAQHNEHRILLPELIYMADMFFLRGRMYLPIALSALFYIGVWCVLAWAAYSQETVASPVREAALLLAAVMMAWNGCSTVISTPFQIPFTLLQFLSALALAALVKLAEGGRTVYLAAVIVLAAAGTYSLGNGMLLWIVLIVGGLLLRIGTRHMLILTLAAVVATGAYFIGYKFLPSHMGENLKHPLQALEFVCSYISMPFGAFGSARRGIQFGAMNILLMCICFAVAWQRGLLKSRLGTVVFGLYLFTLLGAGMTSLGRMDLNDRDFILSKAWRYVTMPVLGWALVALTLIWLAGELVSRDWALAVSLLAAAFFAYGFVNAKNAVRDARRDFGAAQIVATMLQNNVFDRAAVLKIFPSAEFVQAQLKPMQEDRKSIYARGPDKWLGQDISHLLLSPVAAPGAITQVYPFPGGLRILGWADVTRLTSDHAVLFVDANNKIVGFGRRPSAVFPQGFTLSDTPNSLAFVGYVSLARPLGPLSVYVRTSSRGNSFQRLNGTITIPPFTLVDSSVDTPLLPGITWQPDANWTLRGYAVTADNGPAPAGEIYASWGGLDTNTGSFQTAPFAAPANHCLVLPVLTGGSSFGQSVEVRDADTQQTIAELPLSDRATWERWRITLPDSSRNLQIIAGDEGTSMYEWVAIANPQQCQ